MPWILLILLVLKMSLDISDLGIHTILDYEVLSNEHDVAMPNFWTETVNFLSSYKPTMVMLHPPLQSLIKDTGPLQGKPP